MQTSYESMLELYWKMETTIVCWGDIGIMEKDMETSLVEWGIPSAKNIGLQLQVIPAAGFA